MQPESLLNSLISANNNGLALVRFVLQQTEIFIKKLLIIHLSTSY